MAVEQGKFKVKRGEVCLVSEIPDCQFCPPDDHVPGPFDFKMAQGPWANGCEMHWIALRMFPTLGEGKAQRWVTADQVA